MSRSYSPPTPAPGWAAYQAQGLAIGDWRAQVTFDDPNPLPSGTDCVNDHDVLAPPAGTSRGRRLLGQAVPLASLTARRDSGRGASAGLGRDKKEPVPAGHDRPGAGVLVQGA